MREETQKPGLPAVYELRAARKAGRFARVSPAAVLYSALGLAGVMFAYSAWTGHQMSQQRDGIVNAWAAAQKQYALPVAQVGAAVDAAFADARGAWRGEALPSKQVPLTHLLYVRAKRADLGLSIHDLAADSSRDAAVVCLAQQGGVPAAEVPNLHSFENGRALLDVAWRERVATEDRGVRLGLYARQLSDTISLPSAPFPRLGAPAQGVLLVVDEAEPGAHSVYYAAVGAPVARTQLKVQAGVTEAGSHDAVDEKIWAAARRQAMGCALGHETAAFLAKVGGAPKP